MNTKCYIFFTNGIIDLGGIELYLVNKELWLKQNDWDVHVFSASYTKDNFKIKSLEKYRNEIFPTLSYAPYECPKICYNKTIKNILKLLGDTNKYKEIIIESHSGSTAIWAEIIAKNINAIHIMQPLHEVYNEKCYVEKRDFFIFKLNRKEIYGGRITFIRDVLKENTSKWQNLRLQYNPVLDVDDERLLKIQNANYTICYFGRTAKPYYKSILEGVREFADMHVDKNIQLVVVGNEKDHKNVMKQLNMHADNLIITVLGEMFPVPRKLFELVDVVCAGAGSANAAVFENVPVLIPDPDNYLCNGLYGYDTCSPLTREANIKQLRFCDAFENTLIKCEYQKNNFLLDVPPSVNDCCKEVYNSIKTNKQKNEYYDIDKLVVGNANFKKKFGVLVRIIKKEFNLFTC